MRPKRLISLLVAVCMMITMLPLSAVTAFAADTSTVRTAIVDGYKYEYTINTEDDTATIKYFRGPVDSEGNVDSANNGPYDIDIPSELDHHPVTGLGAYSFSGYASASPYPHNSYQIGRNIRSVDIPQGVTSIGNHAFFDCFDLENITIPQSVTSIGDVAFGCCKFTTLSLGENIETNIETIGDDAFYYCIELESVTIPQSVTSIGNDAFGQCHDLQSLTIKDAATSIGHRAFLGCTSLETISLGENIKTIGYHAFNSCTSINLTNVTIPENVTTIRPGTFDYCTHLEYIMLPAGLTSFQDSLKGCPAGNPNGAIYYKTTRPPQMLCLQTMMTILTLMPMIN